jgi:hypothetical protein
MNGRGFPAFTKRLGKIMVLGLEFVPKPGKPVGRQPVGDSYVHSATRCAWWQTTQFCQNKIATDGF